MPDLDWTKCPICGEIESFEIWTDEQIYGSSSLRLEMDNAGKLTQVDSFDTEIGWNTAKVVGFFGSCCRETLPDAYCAELDRVREQDET